MAITSFKDEYAFLSNFYPSHMVFEGRAFLSAEAAYQCQKCANPEDKAQFSTLEPGAAKRLGRKVECIPHWEVARVGIMRAVLREKFEQNKDLVTLLLGTGKEQLIEGNKWHDTFWGVCDGVGSNYLGILLMDLRMRYIFEMNERGETE